jgi:acyl-CoA reductase-like NAD-dependent aldehyde dehydrogenase
VTLGYTDEEIRDLFDLWLDHHRAHRPAERRGLIERMPHLLRERDKLLAAMSLGDMTEPEKVAAGLRVQSLAKEIAETYARIRGQDRPPPAATASWA